MDLDVALLGVYLSLIVLVKQEFSVPVSHSRLLLRQGDVAVYQRVPQIIRVEVGYNLPSILILLRLLPRLPEIFIIFLISD